MQMKQSIGFLIFHGGSKIITRKKLIRSFPIQSNQCSSISLLGVSKKLLQSEFMSSVTYDEVVEKDLDLLWAILEWVSRSPRLDNIMQKIVSKHPWQDIACIPWLFSIVGFLEFGFPHFWVVTVNLFFAFGKNILPLLCGKWKPKIVDNLMQLSGNSSSLSDLSNMIEDYGHLQIQRQIVMGNI